MTWKGSRPEVSDGNTVEQIHFQYLLKAFQLLHTVWKFAFFSSVSQSCLTLCDPVDCSMSGFHVHYQLLELAQTHVHQVGDVIQPSHPSTSPSPPTFNLSQHQGLFKWVSSLLRWPEYWSFSFSISFSNEYSRLISIRIEWFDLLAVQGTLKSLLQHHSSKPSILQHSVFSIVQFSRLFMITGKTIALTIITFVHKLMSQPFNTLFRIVIVFFQGGSIF